MDSAPHPFSLRQLQYAVAVADALSFRRAAARCHVSQPSLSAQLAQLERGLGVRLFERDRRRVLLTPAGGELVARARRVLLEASDLVAAAARAVDPLHGALRLGVIPTCSPYLLPDVSPLLRTRFPRLTVQWTEDKTEVLVGRLAAGTLDAALVALEAPLGDVEHHVIGRDPFVLVAPAGHPLMASSTPLTRAELNGVGVLLLDDGHCFRSQALAFCSTAKAKELAFRATSLPTLVQMVASGAGVTLLPELAVPTELARSRLRRRSFRDPAPFRTLALIWRRRSPLGPALTAVATAIGEAHGETIERRSSGARNAAKR
ncbi:MAG TPA: LysR substrate-binding domain-containing protein [Polyangia bacterium]|jgi:LysR family hydrogen peroxide-inducible transcriptional activator